MGRHKENLARPLHLKRIVTAGLASWFALCCGCGDNQRLPVYRCKGLLTVDDKPLGPAKFVLIPTDISGIRPGPSVAGSSDSQGNVTLNCYAHNDGAPAGEYLVMFSPDLRGDSTNNVIPEVYAHPEENGLRVTVSPTSDDRPNDVSLNLKGQWYWRAKGKTGFLMQPKAPFDPRLTPESPH